MSKMNAVGWFDIYVHELDRAVKFYETVLGTKLEPIGDPTGENQMMSFPADMSAYGAGGALHKVTPCFSRDRRHHCVFFRRGLRS